MILVQSASDMGFHHLSSRRTQFNCMFLEGRTILADKIKNPEKS